MELRILLIIASLFANRQKRVNADKYHVSAFLKDRIMMEYGTERDLNVLITRNLLQPPNQEILKSVKPGETYRLALFLFTGRHGASNAIGRMRNVEYAPATLILQDGKTSEDKPRHYVFAHIVSDDPSLLQRIFKDIETVVSITRSADVEFFEMKLSGVPNQRNVRRPFLVVCEPRGQKPLHG